jgi:hypothetical protein
MSNIKLFHDQHIRSYWDAEQEEWFFSVVDVVAALTDSTNPTDYLKKLRKRDGQLGGYIGTNCPQVAMQSATGKSRNEVLLAVGQMSGRLGRDPEKCYRFSGFLSGAFT